MPSLVSVTRGECSTMSVKVAIPAMLLLMVCACQNDTLEQGVPQLVVEAEPPEPNPSPGARGTGPWRHTPELHHRRQFSAREPLTYALTDLEAEIVESSGGEVIVSTIPTNLEGGEVSELKFWVKVPQEENFEAVIDLVSNAPIPTRLVLRGTGIFIGEPRLEVSWDAVIHPWRRNVTTVLVKSTAQPKH